MPPISRTGYQLLNTNRQLIFDPGVVIDILEETRPDTANQFVPVADYMHVLPLMIRISPPRQSDIANGYDLDPEHFRNIYGKFCIDKIALYDLTKPEIDGVVWQHGYTDLTIQEKVRHEIKLFIDMESNMSLPGGPTDIQKFYLVCMDDKEYIDFTELGEFYALGWDTVKSQGSFVEIITHYQWLIACLIMANQAKDLHFNLLDIPDPVMNYSNKPQLIETIDQLVSRYAFKRVWLLGEDFSPWKYVKKTFRNFTDEIDKTGFKLFSEMFGRSVARYADWYKGAENAKGKRYYALDARFYKYDVTIASTGVLLDADDPQEGQTGSSFGRWSVYIPKEHYDGAMDFMDDYEANGDELTLPNLPEGSYIDTEDWWGDVVDTDEMYLHSIYPIPDAVGRRPPLPGEGQPAPSLSDLSPNQDWTLTNSCQAYVDAVIDTLYNNMGEDMRKINTLLNQIIQIPGTKKAFSEYVESGTVDIPSIRYQLEADFMNDNWDDVASLFDRLCVLVHDDYKMKLINIYKWWMVYGEEG